MMTQKREFPFPQTSRWLPSPYKQFNKLDKSFKMTTLLTLSCSLIAIGVVHLCYNGVTSMQFMWRESDWQYAGPSDVKMSGRR